MVNDQRARLDAVMVRAVESWLRGEPGNAQWQLEDLGKLLIEEAAFLAAHPAEKWSLRALRVNLREQQLALGEMAEAFDRGNTRRLADLQAVVNQLRAEELELEAVLSRRQRVEALARRLWKTVLPADLSPVDVRDHIAKSVRMRADLVASFQMEATAEADDLIAGLARIFPALDSRLKAARMEMIAALSASASRGRPRKGQHANGNATDTLLVLLKTLKLADKGATKNTLKSARRRANARQKK